MRLEGDRTTVEDGLAHAMMRLSAKGLFRPGDVLSQRIPEWDAFVCLRIGAGSDAPGFEWVGLSDPPGGLHHQVYAARPDVGAVLSGGLPWSTMLSRLGLPMPAIFDEQVRHLGVEVGHLGDGEPAVVMSHGANAYCLEDGALCFGMGLERLLLNIEILEKCAESYVLAQCASGTVKRIPWLVRHVANRRLSRDQKEAASRHLRGERSLMKDSY